MTLYNRAMAKKAGRYSSFIAQLATRIIGDELLVHCSAAADTKDNRVSIPDKIHSEMLSKMKI